MRKSGKTAAVRGAADEYRIFISHATVDKWIACALCEKLDAVGAVTFRDDRDIRGGDDIPDEIRRQLKRAHELVVLVTPDSVHRPWVLLEVGGAWLKSKSMRIVAVHCHVDFDAIPDLLKSKKSISINDFDKYVEDVRRRVAARR